MKPSDRWALRVDTTDTPWLEAEIIYFRKAIGSAGLKDATTRRRLAREFIYNAMRLKYRITEEHSVKGQQYLLSKSLRQDGTERSGNRLGSFEIGVLKDLDRHMLVNLYRPQEAFESYLPVYRAIDSKGAWFEYVGATYEQVRVLAIGKGSKGLAVVK